MTKYILAGLIMGTAVTLFVTAVVGLEQATAVLMPVALFLVGGGVGWLWWSRSS